MGKYGQIVEILETSPVYNNVSRNFHSKKDELWFWSREKQYSLFDGILIGAHEGLEHYQIGQRKKISGGGHHTPLYVIGKDEAENRLFVGAGKNHPGLMVKVYHISKKELEMINENIDQGMEVVIGINEKEDNIKAQLFYWDDDYFLEFDKMQNKIDLMQGFSVFHENTLLFKTKD